MLKVTADARKFGLGQTHQMRQRIGCVCGIKKLAQRSAGSPDRYVLRTRNPGFMTFPDQRRNHMRALQFVVVAGAVEVGRHRGKKLRAVFAVVAPAHFHAGQLGHGIGAIGRLQRPGQNAGLADRLRAIARIDARRPQIQQTLDLASPGFVDQVRRDQRVFTDELRRIGAVGDDPADLRGGDKHVLRLLAGKKFTHGGKFEQIQLLARSQQQVRMAACLEAAHDRRTDQPAMPCDKDPRVAFQAASFYRVIYGESAMLHAGGVSMRKICRRCTSSGPSPMRIRRA